MIAYWGNDLVCKYANRAYLDWFGVEPKSLVNKMSIQTLLGLFYLPNEPYINAALKGDVQVFRRDIQSPSGHSRHAITTYCPAFKGNHITGFYMHIEDASPSDAVSKPAQRVHNFPQNRLARGRDPVNEVKQALDSALFEKFPGISNLAKHHYISEAKLKNDFKTRFNQGLFTYYRHQQMELAEQYLKDRKYTKKQIANLFNFTNATNFTICYQKYLKEKASRKVIGELTKANDDRYKTFITQGPFAVAMLDQSMKFIAASQKYIEDYHLEFKLVEGSDYDDIFPASDPKWKKIHQAALKGKVLNGEDLSFQRENGSQIAIKWDIRPWRNQQGDIGGILIFTEDITALKLKEEENRKILEILSKANEAIRIGAWKKNFKNNTGYWSKVTREILEVAADFNPTSAPEFEFYKEGASRTKMKKLISEAMSLGQSFDVTTEIITARGNRKTVRVVGYSEFRKGKCERLFGIFQEIKVHR